MYNTKTYGKKVKVLKTGGMLYNAGLLIKQSNLDHYFCYVQVYLSLKGLGELTHNPAHRVMRVDS